MSDDKIRCTFEGCYQTFNTVEQMKKHKDKAKDEIHEWYCKRCDEDCEDDITFAMHQIQSRKHIACPVCGAEFRSEGGRDRHVGINHNQHAQALKCPGCKGVVFESASALMEHIEKNKCKIITRDDFHKHRAEQQIEKDELEELEGSVYQNANMRAPMGSDPDTTGGISLLDNERVYPERDWQGNVRSDPRTSHPGHAGSTAEPLTRGLSDLAINNYPALRATRATDSNTTQSDWAQSNTSSNNGDLLDIQKEPEVRSSQPTTLLGNHNVWGNNNRLVNSRPQTQRRPAASPSSNLLDSASSVNLLSSAVSGNTAATRGTRQTATNHANSNSNTTDPIPPAARPENQDPNAPNAQIQTQPSKPRLPSRLDLHRYWDSIQSCYVCPGSKCGARIYSVQSFEAHLLTEAHIAEKVTCPSCLKKFKTTAALVAHAESGSVHCDLRKTQEYDLVLRNITAGLVRLDGQWKDGRTKYKSVPVSEW